MEDRLHLDLRTGEDYPDSAEALRSRGATRLYDAQQGRHSWVTLADPEGNEFCVSR